MLRSLTVVAASLAVARPGFATSLEARNVPAQQPITNVQLGPRPYFLIDNMDPGPLKDKLLSCSELEVKPTNFSIGHRGGGTMLMPEETRESMVAGPRMGAAVVECDVVFTSDKKLVVGAYLPSRIVFEFVVFQEVAETRRSTSCASSDILQNSNCT